MRGVTETIMIPLVAGLIAGGSLLAVPGSTYLCITSLALFLACVRASRSIFASHLIFGASCTVVGGYWIPEALRTLGATAAESDRGFALAILGAAMPGFAVLGAISHATRRLSRDTWFVLFCIGLAIIETAMLTVSGGMPWILFGYAAIDQAGLSQLAAVGGVPLVSVVLVICAEAIARLGQRRSLGESRISFAILVGLGATATFGLPFAKAVSPPTILRMDTVRFVAIQPVLPRSERLRPSLQELNAQRLTRYTQHILEELSRTSSPIYVVWPENAIVDGIHGPAHARRLASAAAAALRRRLVLGTTNRVGGNFASTLRNRVTTFSSKGEWLSSVDKVRVVPVVESNGDGGLERFARRIVGIAGRGANVSPARETAPLVGAGHAAIGLCFEILFPNVVTARRPKIATALINLADNSWIRDPAVSRQLITIARYRAIEQRLPLLRIAHGAGSAHYDAYGRLVDSLPQDRYGALVVDADPTRAPQLRERASILALPVGAAMTAWFLYPPIWSRSSG